MAQPCSGARLLCPAAGPTGRGNVAHRQPELWSVLVNRKSLVLGLALALTIGMSCTSGELPLEGQIEKVPSADGGAAPADTAGAVPPDTAGALPPDTAGTLPPDTAGTEPSDTAG